MIEMFEIRSPKKNLNYFNQYALVNRKEKNLNGLTCQFLSDCLNVLLLHLELILMYKYT